MEGRGLTPRTLDERSAAEVTAAEPAIDDQIGRQLVFDVARATARDLDHTAIRSYKARALHFQLDLRRPELGRVDVLRAPLRRQTLPETVRDFLQRRPLHADLDRTEFVRLGGDYVE